MTNKKIQLYKDCEKELNHQARLIKQFLFFEKVADYMFLFTMAMLVFLVIFNLWRL